MSKAKELIENNTLTNITVESEGVVYKEIAMTAVNMAKLETKEKCSIAFRNFLLGAFLSNASGEERDLEKDFEKLMERI